MNARRGIINWEIPEAEFDSNTSKYISRKKYSSGWSIACVWPYASAPVPESVVILRETANEELAIEGLLTFLKNGEAIVKKKFVKLMKSGSKSIEIELAFNLRFRKSNRSSLLLKGHFDVSTGTLTTLLPYYKKREKKLMSLARLAFDFSMLMSPETSRIPADVNLKCGSASIAAHKFVLSVRSPVFAAMFDNPMRESKESEVIITDISELALRAVVKYMYTGMAVKMSVSLAIEIVCAAEKYQLQCLKREACDFLNENVSVENVLLFLDIGDAIAEDLKSFAMDYICQCPDLSAIQNTEAWKALEKLKPYLAVEILKSVVKSRDEKIKKLKT